MNGIHLSVQFRFFVLDPQHFIDQTFKFFTAFLYDFKVLNEVVRC